MKLWLISNTGKIVYDSYDSAVVAAETEEEARNIHPSGSEYSSIKFCIYWQNIENVKVEYLGDTPRKIKGVICASFNAG